MNDISGPLPYGVVFKMTLVKNGKNPILITYLHINIYHRL